MRGAIGLALFIVLGASGPAMGGQDEWQVAFVPAYAIVDFDARTPSGAGAALAVLYGLSDSWALRAEAVGSLHPADADKDKKLPEGTLTVVGGYAGVRYAFDLLRTIPYLDVGLGVLSAQGAGTPANTNFSYQATIGFDRLESYRFSWGFAVSYHAFVSNFDRLPIYLHAGPSFSFRWD